MAAARGVPDGARCRRRRGEFVRLFGVELRAHKEALGRLVTLEAGKIVSEGAGRGPGDDRHLRLRGRPVAPALRAAPSRPSGRTIGMMETWHPLGVAGSFGLQFPGRGVGVERSAGAGVRRPGACGSRRRRRRSRRSPCRRWSSARMRRFGRRPGGGCPGRDRRPRDGRGAGGRPPIAAGLGHRLDAPWAAPSRRVLAARFARAILELGGNNAAIVCAVGRPRTGGARRSPSPPWAPRASAAPRCAGCSSTRLSTSASCRGCGRVYALRQGRRSARRRTRWSARSSSGRAFDRMAGGAGRRRNAAGGTITAASACRGRRAPDGLLCAPGAGRNARRKPASCATRRSRRSSM